MAFCTLWLIAYSWENGENGKVGKRNENKKGHSKFYFETASYNLLPVNNFLL